MENKTKQNKTKQNKTKQNKTKQNSDFWAVGQLASAAASFAKFHPGIREPLSDIWPFLLEQPIKLNSYQPVEN